MRGVSPRDTNRDVELFYESFGDSSINFVVRFWVDYAQQTDYLKARSDAVQRIKQAYDENGITIPFPIRTLEFGIVGGEKLSETLSHTRLSLTRAHHEGNGEKSGGENAGAS